MFRPSRPSTRQNPRSKAIQVSRHQNNIQAQARFINTKTNYVVLIGGGRAGHLYDRFISVHPEHGHYLNILYAASELTGHFCAKENLHVLFASGENPPQTVIDHRLIFRTKNYLTGAPSIIADNQTLINCKPNNAISLEMTFDHLTGRIKSGDTLLIYIDGHGTKFIGTALWNKFVTSQVLGPAFLEKLLRKIHPEAKAIILVTSCSSGNFLKIKRQNTIVLTDTSIGRIAYGTVAQRSEFIDGWLKYILDHESDNFLLQHANASLTGWNYYASDTLSDYLDSNIKKQLPQQFVFKFHHIYQNIMVSLQGNRYSFLNNLIIEFALIAAILSLPTDNSIHHAISEFIDLKIGITALKTSPFMFKIFFAALVPSAFKKFQSSKFYRNLPTVEDRMIIKFSEYFLKSYNNDNVSTETKIFITSVEHELDRVLSKLYELKEAGLSDPVTSKYHYLFDKALLFIIVSLYNNHLTAITQFLHVANQTIDPLERNKVDEKNLTISKQFLRKHPLFSVVVKKDNITDSLAPDTSPRGPTNKS